MNYAYYSVMHIIREVYFGYCFRYIHSNGASFIFIFIIFSKIPYSTDDIRGVGSIIYTSSNQAIAISKSNNPLNMCLFIILFNYFYYNYHYV